MRRLITALGAALALVLPAAGDTYPSRSITMVVPFAAGGTTDIIARLVSDHMARTLGQSIIVENVAGAGGTTGSLRVAKATPDGYTIMMGNMGTHSASVGLYPNLAYDPRTDFAPIMNAAGTPMLISAHKDFPANNFKEFVALLKADPSKYNYGHGGVGSTSHLTCVYFHHLIKAPVQHVPFRGSGPALNALLAKQLDFVCDQTVTIIPQLANLKTFVVATPKRLDVAKDIPTSAEGGLPEFQAVGWNAMFAPKATQPEIVEKLNAAGRKALADPALRQKLLDLGCEIPDEAGQSPAALGAHVRAEVDKWTPVIKAAGVTAQ